MITKFVDLRRKMYSFLFDCDGGRKNFNKTKGKKESVVRDYIVHK